ncbi:MAG TPA: hypothetical protein VII12_12750 [Thermoanaerobaculia bacterium]
MRGFVVAAIVCATFASVARAQSADLGVTKSGTAVADADTDVPYSVTVTNLGPDDSLSVSLNDNIPAGMTFVSEMQNSGPLFSCVHPMPGSGGTVSCTIALLPSGSSATFTFVFHIAPMTPGGTTFTNIATASAETLDPNDENNSGVAGTSTPFPPQADLAVTKTGPLSAAPNTDVTFNISLSNSSPNAGENVTLHDLLPGTMTFVSFTQTGGPMMNCVKPMVGAGGAVDCTAALFTASSTATFVLIGHVPSGEPSGTIFPNTATISASNDPNPENDSSTASVTVSSVDISITKSGPATVTAGNSMNYTITVANAGPDAASNVVWSDPLPPGTTFVSLVQNTGPPATCGSPTPGASGTVSCGIVILASGTSAQFTLTVLVGNVVSITNTASATTDSFDTNTANNSSSVMTTVTPVADLAVTKTDAPDPVLAGSNITYTITLTNNGPSDASSLSLTDAVPANTTFVSFTAPAGWATTTPPAGGSGTVTATRPSLIASASSTFTLVVNVNLATAAGTTITNTASATSGTSDPNAANNSAIATTMVAAAIADLSITKTAAPVAPAYAANTDITYTMTVTNGGPSTASAVTVTDTIPLNMTFVSSMSSQGTCTGTGPVSCALGTMTSGATATVTVVARTTAQTGFATNVATVSSTTIDPNPANNSASVSLPVPTLSNLLLALLALVLGAVAFLKLR